MKNLILVVCLLLVAACGKNNPMYPVNNGFYPPVAPGPQGPYQQFPYQQMPNQFPGYGQGGTPYYGGGQPIGFRPQMPAQMPQQYTPFLPIDNFFRQSQQMMQMWQQMWMQWVQYSQMVSVSAYAFNPFWYDFAPQYFQQMGMSPLYSYFNQNFYGWMTPQMQYNPQIASPGAFWGNYSGYRW